MNPVPIIFRSMDTPPTDDPNIKQVVSPVVFVLSVLAITSLGSVAKLLNDYKDEEVIQRRLWYAYLSSGLLSGGVLSLILAHFLHGPSYLIIGVAGLAGFQSIQLLTWGALLLQKTLEKFSSK